MIDVTFFSALLGGLLTFFAPCTLPLIPAYIAFISGSGVVAGEHSLRALRKRTFQNALLFALGFSFVFILFGMASGALGKFLMLHRTLIAQLGGVLVIYLGLSMLDVLKLPLVPKFFSVGWNKKIVAGSRFGAFLLGLLFALGWTPCLGPILGTILLLAGSSGTVLSGGFLLGVYSLGIAIPFLLIAYLYGSTFSYLPKVEKYLPYFKTIGGLLIILIGVLLVLGQFGILNTWAAQLVGSSTFDALVEYM